MTVRDVLSIGHSALRVVAKDTSTLSTWDEFNEFHRDAFVERITAFVERVGS